MLACSASIFLSQRLDPLIGALVVFETYVGYGSDLLPRFARLPQADVLACSANQCCMRLSLCAARNRSMREKNTPRKCARNRSKLGS